MGRKCSGRDARATIRTARRYARIRRQSAVATADGQEGQPTKVVAIAKRTQVERGHVQLYRIQPEILEKGGGGEQGAKTNPSFGCGEM
jgi:hypothetical protein